VQHDPLPSLSVLSLGIFSPSVLVFQTLVLSPVDGCNPQVTLLYRQGNEMEKKMLKDIKFRRRIRTIITSIKKGNNDSQSMQLAREQMATGLIDLMQFMDKRGSRG
jgi:hypothetical protein